MRNRLVGMSLLFIVGMCLLAIIIYNIPPVHERLARRVNNWRVQIKRYLTPPEEMVFVPQEQQEVIEAIVQATIQALALSPTPSLFPTLTPSLTAPVTGPTATSPPSPTPTVAPTPIPGRVSLEGIRYQAQIFNNCGPANLAMALSYWGWQGDQYDTRAFLRPNPDVDDKNVMPAEMVDFVESQTNLKALVRVGGDLDLLRKLIAAGYPVLIEKGHHPPGDWWMGHFAVLNAYDDEHQRFTAQDSLIQPDSPLPYSELNPWWRNFNYLYLVIYPPEEEAQVLFILGPQADEIYNYQHAAGVAKNELSTLTGRDLYFAWYNLGSSLVALSEHSGAATAYDQAFAINANLPEKDRLYRMLWYQDGPYEAYFHTARYQDVIDLGNATLAWVGEPLLEETFYWMGLAREAQGNLEKAIYDLKMALNINPNATHIREHLLRLGVGDP